MGEAVVQEEEVGRGLQPPQGLEACLMAVRPHHHGHSGKLARQKHRLIPGDERTEDRPVSRAHHPHPFPLAAVAAGEDADGEATVAQVSRHGGHQGGLAGASPMEVPDAQDRPWQAAGAVRYQRRRRRWAPP